MGGTDVLRPGESHEDIAGRIEAFIRSSFHVVENDTRFSRTRPLFEEGYIDSVGFVELLGFLDETFGVTVPDEILISDEFTTIDGIAAVVGRYRKTGAGDALS